MFEGFKKELTLKENKKRDRKQPLFSEMERCFRGGDISLNTLYFENKSSRNISVENTSGIVFDAGLFGKFDNKRIVLEGLY